MTNLSTPVLVGIAALAGFGASAVVLEPGLLPGVTQVVIATTGAGCNIKGNVSMNSGERIYHVPGQRYYVETAIRREYGERYFCSEAEARAAGWRRSGV